MLLFCAEKRTYIFLSRTEERNGTVENTPCLCPSVKKTPQYKEFSRDVYGNVKQCVCMKFLASSNQSIGAVPGRRSDRLGGIVKIGLLHVFCVTRWYRDAVGLEAHTHLLMVLRRLLEERGLGACEPLSGSSHHVDTCYTSGAPMLQKAKEDLRWRIYFTAVNNCFRV